MNELRRSKLESLVMHLLSKLISMQDIKDYRVGTDVSVTAVKMSNDGAYADVHVSSFQSADHSIRGAEGLNCAAGFIRRKLAPKLHLRKIPDFRFHPDHSFRIQMAMEKRLEGLTAGAGDKTEED
ncbi:30S ribosome-binding factor RbfA [Candidatus Haliotispira prima]|uniref:Ribosome-binding factor A n=1 Tax=Candidatus Haliotispira prima TaxID=3034016 RepID=A0ABY8MJP1_9SPIO|nr:30S ribosome-binding factor RbfA [Candidatus Haliotispira prima]